MLWVKSIFKIENSIIDSILQEYDELLASLNAKDTKNQFYISCDRAYMLYLMQQYQRAIDSYDELIGYADENQAAFAKELQSLYAERGWAKARLGDNDGANLDFKASDIPAEQLADYEPSFVKQAFVREKF
jgi:tetratricopeptide (TPR) repeat protein